jgi:hypothetical protein
VRPVSRFVLVFVFAGCLCMALTSCGQPHRNATTTSASTGSSIERASTSVTAVASTTSVEISSVEFNELWSPPWDMPTHLRPLLMAALKSLDISLILPATPTFGSVQGLGDPSRWQALGEVREDRSYPGKRASLVIKDAKGLLVADVVVIPKTTFSTTATSLPVTVRGISGRIVGVRGSGASAIEWQEAGWTYQLRLGLLPQDVALVWLASWTRAPD